MQPLVLSQTQDHITPVLKDLHWLPVNQRIKYQLCLMMHQSIYSSVRTTCGISLHQLQPVPRDVGFVFHWLPVKQRIEFKLCLLVHHTLNGRAPAYLKDRIETTASVPGQTSNRSARNNYLVTQRTRLKLSERAFSVAAPRIWNQLAIDIKAATDTQAFKRKLKTHMFLPACLQ